VRACLGSQDKGTPKRYMVFEREGGDARSRDRMPRLLLPSGPCLQRCSGSAQTRGKSVREGMDARTIVRSPEAKTACQGCFCPLAAAVDAHLGLQKPQLHAKAVFALWPLMFTLLWWDGLELTSVI